MNYDTSHLMSSSDVGISRLRSHWNHSGTTHNIQHILTSSFSVLTVLLGSMDCGLGGEPAICPCLFKGDAGMLFGTVVLKRLNPSNCELYWIFHRYSMMCFKEIRSVPKCDSALLASHFVLTPASFSGATVCKLWWLG